MNAHDAHGRGSALSPSRNGTPNQGRRRLRLSTERGEGPVACPADRPKVTVITPTYNRPDYLPEAIRSVVQQEMEDWEMFVINDGGVDVGEVVAQFDDARITYINRDVNRGKAACLNECLELARGEYVAYLDDDDAWYPDHLAVLSTTLDEHPEIGAAYSDLYRVVCVVGEDGTRFPIEKKVEICRDYNRTFMWHFNHTLHVSLMHRLDLARKVGGYHEGVRVLIDWDLTRKLSFYTDFLHVPRVTGEYYEPVADSDRISDVQRRDNENYLHNLRRVRSDLPPEPWPHVPRVLLVRPMNRWNADEIAAVRELADHIDHPCRIALVNTAEGVTEESCRDALGKLSELGHIHILQAPGATPAEAYGKGAAVWESEYCYLVGENLKHGFVLRVIRAMGYLEERGASCVRWEQDGVDAARGYDVFARRSALPAAGAPIPPDHFREAPVMASEWPIRAGERRRFPLEQDMMFLTVTMCEENGAWEKAASLLAQIDELDQGALQGPYLIQRHMRVALQLGEFERAESMCRDLIGRGYGADNHVRLGRVLQQAGRYAQAAQAYRNALDGFGLTDQDLDRPELKLTGEECALFRAMVGLGECLVALGDGHRAAPVLRRAGGLCASSHRPALAFGRMFMQQGYLQEAEQALRMARSRECGEALCEINQTLSEVYERQGRMLPAYQAARAALQDRPDDPALVQRCVTLALSLGRPGDAEQLYRSLLELRPGNVQALRGLAELCTAAGRPDEADRLLETASLLTGAAQ